MGTPCTHTCDVLSMRQSVRSPNFIWKGCYSIYWKCTIPRSMIPDAAFRDFPTGKCQESGDRIRLPILTGSCRFRAEPDKSGCHEISGKPWNWSFPSIWVGRKISIHRRFLCLSLIDCDGLLTIYERGKSGSWWILGSAFSPLVGLHIRLGSSKWSEVTWRL
jgi:hypothetical protein